ncbi:transposase [Brucella sp. 09RB8471]|uniref:IS110 family transposase n=1 Tax=Brucella sp. 09RB8471 TaxID=1149952 RepID=UPI002092EB70|nr:transposase [Brucella sp. 09RB8471]
MAAYQNTPAGIADFLTFVVSLEGIERLVLEPTGGYERHVVAALQAARLPVAKVNAKQVRQFARAGGQLSKTDRIDAFILADYARRMETRILLQRSSRERVLADFVSRYRQLSHMIVQEKNRREKASGQTKDWVEESLNFLLDQRQTVVDAMTACLKADADLGRKAEVLMSLKGSACERPASSWPTCRNWGISTKDKLPSWLALRRLIAIAD